MAGRSWFVPPPILLEPSLTHPESSTGTILFGGYDHDKYIGELTTHPIIPNPKTKKIDSMLINWTSLCIRTSAFDLHMTPDNFSANAVLDAGTTLTILPESIFSGVATYFEATNISNTWIVEFSIAQEPLTLDFGFSGLPQRIRVEPSEIALPILFPNGTSFTTPGGHNACLFGFTPSPDGDDILFGDTFLRSAYVVYDLDKQEISIGQTNFQSTTSNITEITTGDTV